MTSIMTRAGFISINRTDLAQVRTKLTLDVPMYAVGHGKT